MTPDEAAVAAFVAGAALGAGGARWALAARPGWSLRTNVSGREVPAILGIPVALAGLLPLPFQGLTDGLSSRSLLAAGAVLAIMALAGLVDDRRGDESARGFAGHLSAGRVTGGVVKLVAGGVAGFCAGRLLHGDDIAMVWLTALAVPLTANLVNLLDRAPGRAAKATLLMALPLLVLGDPEWRNAAAATLGALLAVVPADLREQGMLGDAGANPLGALVGVGLGASLGPAALGAAVALLLLLNLASERWSFSRAIERTRWLRALDAIGRK